MKQKIKSTTAQKKELLTPKFKGRTKIELFENGEKVFEQIDENMQTSVLTEIFNPKRLYTAGEYGYNLYANNTPIYNTVLGGLLLYEDEIAESVNTRLAPLDNTCVGHAGSEYSGTNEKRGTFNTNESGFINADAPWEGYQYVWDFGTDKANGTISCACLTSLWGGNCGYGKGINYATTENDNSFFSSLTNPKINDKTNAMAFIINGCGEMFQEPRYLGENSNGRAMFCFVKNSTTLVYFEFDAENLNVDFVQNLSSTQSLDFNLANTEHKYNYKIKTFTLPFSIASSYYISTFVKDGNYYIVNKTSTTTFSYTIFSPITQTLSEQNDINVNTPYQNYTLQENVCLCGDYWFATGTNRELYRYSSAGGEGIQYGTLPSLPTNNYTHLFNFNDDLGIININKKINSSSQTILLCQSAEPNNRYYRYVTSSSTNNSSNYQIPTPDNPTNLMGISSSISSGNLTLTIDMFKLTGYTATINNLFTPVTKQNTQSMKVTYEILPESE